ncbi:MAG: hypothetical protein ACRDTQ_16650 [Micromonosporaceae bacterium]
MILGSGMNAVTFTLVGSVTLIAYAPVRHDDSIQQAWETLKSEHQVRAFDVVAIHSEWEPSIEDSHFLRHTFSNLQDRTHTFPRPAPDGWDAALEAAALTRLDSAASHREQQPPPADAAGAQVTKEEALRRIADKAATGQTPDEAGYGSDLGRFAELALEAFHRAGVADAEFDEDEFAIMCGDGWEIYLDHVHEQWQSWPADERDDRLASWVAQAIEIQDTETPATWGEAAERLRPVLRPASLQCQDKPPLSRPAFPFLREYVVIDSPSSMTYVTPRQLRTWGVEEDAVFDAARENLIKLPYPVGWLEDGPGLYALTDDGDQYLVSWLLLENVLGDIGEAFGQPAVVCAPDYNTLLIGPDDDEAVMTLLETAATPDDESARPLSPLAYVFDPESGFPTAYFGRSADSPVNAAAHRAWWQLAAEEYEQQREWLAEKYLDDLELVFVASVMVIETDDGGVVGATVVGEGVQNTMLPAVDVVFFMTEAGDQTAVAWDDAERVLGLTAEPDLDPPRFRQPSFPTPEQMAQLQAVAVDL